jgi:hypothetical protein
MRNVTYQAGWLPSGHLFFVALLCARLHALTAPRAITGQCPLMIGPRCYSCTLTLTSPTLRSPSIPYITLQSPLLHSMRRNSTTTSSSRRKTAGPSLASPTLQPSTSSRSRVRREGFSYHWIFRSNIPKRRSVLLTNDIQKRNFFGMGEVFGVLVNVRVFTPS